MSLNLTHPPPPPLSLSLPLSPALSLSLSLSLARSLSLSLSLSLSFSLSIYLSISLPLSLAISFISPIHFTQSLSHHLHTPWPHHELLFFLFLLLLLCDIFLHPFSSCHYIFAGLYKSNLSLFSNSTTAFITTTSPSRSTASQFHGTPHQAITFQNSPREIDIDEACERFPPRRPTTTTTKSVRRSLFPTSINDSGLGASFEDHPPSSFSEDGVESCDEVLMEEIKEAMVELDLSEHEKSKKAEASKPHEKMVVAYSYTGRDDDEVTVRSGDLVTVMYEDSHWFLVETEDMRFGFVPRDCCIPPYSVMMSDTMVTCAGSVACLSVLSEDELLSAYTPSRGSTLDRGRLMRVAPKEKPRTAPRSLDVSCEQLCCTPDRKRGKPKFESQRRGNTHTHTHTHIHTHTQHNTQHTTHTRAREHHSYF